MFNFISLIILVILFCAVTAAFINKKKDKIKSVAKVSDEIERVRRLGNKNKQMNYGSASYVTDENKTKFNFGIKKFNSKRIIKSGRIAFGYIDNKGNYTYREVDVNHMDDEYIDGCCHLAGEFRTFRLDRIQGNVVCRITGEIL